MQEFNTLYNDKMYNEKRCATITTTTVLIKKKP